MKRVREAQDVSYSGSFGRANPLVLQVCGLSQTAKRDEESRALYFLVDTQDAMVGKTTS